MRSRRGLDAVAEGAERDNISLSKPRSVPAALRGFPMAMEETSPAAGGPALCAVQAFCANGAKP